jgi:hypothetical protein
VSRINLARNHEERIAALERETAELRRLLVSRTGHVLRGSGSPEGAVVASVGTLFLRTNGGASTTLYVKESGNGTTGWRAI